MLAASGAVLPVAAQSVSLTGSVSALVDVLPNVPRAATVTELRVRAVADMQVDAKPWLRFRFAGLADGLVADRGGTARDAAGDALEAWVEAGGRRGDVRAGVGRLPWGRLDEVQPTDVINPLDVARYLLDGRAEARVPVAFVRGRVFPREHVSLEAVVVPVFRHGRFDRLDEGTSPFNLRRDLAGPACPAGVPCPSRWSFARAAPPRALQGGGRLAITTGRVDWSLSGWRGFVPFGLIAGAAAGQPATLRLAHPRYTMLGADLETVMGAWAWRAEAAWFPDRPTQLENAPGIFTGDALDAGAGFDRRAGDFTVSATVLYRREARRAARARQNVSLVTGFSRPFRRDRFETRMFAVLNPADEAAFLRGVFSWKPADDLALESSAGWFAGQGDDVITRFGDRDFAYIRVRYHFGR